MFAAWCAAEQRTVLLSERRITHLTQHRDHVETRFRCWCGATGVVTDPRLQAPVDSAPQPAPVDDLAS
jgi:hypothetical protein